MRSEVIARKRKSAGVPPMWTSVLAVIAHPDGASIGLGPILDAFVIAGAKVEMLCLTHGQAWTLDEAPGDLAALRGAELASADDVLGPVRAKMQGGPDGCLSEVCQKKLADEVVAAADSCHPDGLLVFDTAAASGHLDHMAATLAGLLAAETLGLPVLGWNLEASVAAQLRREFGGSVISGQGEDIDMRVTLDRARQRLVSHADASHALPGSTLWRRLEMLADTKSLRWLRTPGGAVVGPGAKRVTGAAEVTATTEVVDQSEVTEPVEARPMRVEHRGGDTFNIIVRGHVITVDQPVKDGGDDTAPTPTELFIASLASCVAFYARRYLARHHLPTEGLAVETTFEMGSRPARVSGIDVRVLVPEGVPAERLDALLAVATHCTVHNTLDTQPDVSITLAANG
jgi:LmbE family N-acetylglucosaminyl deacetylase/uncharacterized OsmC-like protein